MKRMLMAALFTMHTPTLAKYVTKHVVSIYEPVMFPQWLVISTDCKAFSGTRINKFAVTDSIILTNIRLNTFPRACDFAESRVSEYIYIYIYIYIHTHTHTYIYIYTGCHRRNGPNFGRVFLMLNYTDITQNTYVPSWTVIEIMAK